MSNTSATASADTQITFDRGADDHAPELYAHDGLAPTLASLADIDDSQVAFYQQNGYLAVNNVLSPRQISDANAALSDLIHGRVATRPPFALMFEAAVRERINSLTPVEREESVRKVFNFLDLDPRLNSIIHDPTLMAVLNRLGCRDPQIFQTMALLKGPRGREKPWHQDHAYFDVDTRDRLVGLWFALDEARVDNGCMFVMPGKHRDPVIHFKRRDWQICDTTVQSMKQTVLAAPLKPGGVLIFDSLLPHGTPTNHSSLRRRALQFHYAPATARKIANADRMAIFGSEGKDVTC
jgi:phytanoyl-CoA hydroxylase